MKKSTGFLIALLAAGAGAAATFFAIKRKKQLDQYAYDDFDEDFFDNEDECDCGDDCCCDECDSKSDSTEDNDVSEEEVLDSIEDEVEDIDQPRNSDF